MVRTPAQTRGDDWNNLTASIQNRPSTERETIVHFFNEPEYQPVSPDDAVRYWRDFMMPLRDQYGVKLVSPAPSSSPDGTNWIQAFMSALSVDEKPNYLGLHFYTAADSGLDVEVTSAKRYITNQHEKHGLPVIVSEIASTSRAYDDVLAFSQQLAGWMDQQDWVGQYAFFGVSRVVADGFASPAAQQMDGDGNWTELGRYLAGV